MQALPSVDTFSAFPTTTIAHDGITAKRVIVPECGMTTPPSATDSSQVHRERVTGANKKLVRLGGPQLSMSSLPTTHPERLFVPHFCHTQEPNERGSAHGSKLT